MLAVAVNKHNVGAFIIAVVIMLREKVTDDGDGLPVRGDKTQTYG